MQLFYCNSIAVLNFTLNTYNTAKNHSWNEMSYLDKKRKVIKRSENNAAHISRYTQLCID
ncbi:hypothetical protein PBNK5_35400 [Pectobacterium brasiliense]